MHSLTVRFCQIAMNWRISDGCFQRCTHHTTDGDNAYTWVYFCVFFSLFLFFWLMCLNVFTQTSLRFKAFKKTTFPWFFRSSVILSKHKYIYVNSYNAQYVVRQVFLFRSLVDLLVSVHIFCSCLRVDYTWVARWLTKILFVNESKAHDIQKTKYGNSLN